MPVMSAIAMQHLTEQMRAVLQERGPQPVGWLEGILGTTAYQITYTPFARVSMLGLMGTNARCNLVDLFPIIGKQNIYSLIGQAVELGLLVGREWLAGRQTDGLKAAFGFAAVKLFVEKVPLPDGYFAARAHHCNTNTHTKPNYATYDLFQRTQYFMPDSRKWSPRALYILKRVRENRRQHRKIRAIDELKPRFLSPRFAPDYEQLAKELSWTKNYAAEYRRLATESQLPLRVYVLGSGWSRLFDFRKPAL